MTKLKKAKTNLPWCWYCEREFEDDKVLIQHQKSKHFKCHLCSRKLNSAQGMFVHVAQVHKETISIIPNALNGRNDGQIEVYGMDGIPIEDLLKHHEGDSTMLQKIKSNAIGAPISSILQQPVLSPDISMLSPSLSIINPSIPITVPPPPPFIIPTRPVQISTNIIEPLSRSIITKLYYDHPLSIEEKRSMMKRYHLLV